MRSTRLLFALTTLLASHAAIAQFSQQGPKLVGADAAGAAAQGEAVALSGDGNTAIVGGHLDSSGFGAAWIWTRNGGVWTQQGSKLVGAGGVIGPGYLAVDQGRAVALSADGNTAIVGGCYDNDGVGAAWIWTRSQGIWSQQGPKLVGSGYVPNFAASGCCDGVPTADVFQGWTVALSGDGNTAIVGGPGDNGRAGAVWIWTRSGGVWTQQGPKLVGSGSVKVGIQTAQQGSSVAISGDGNTALVAGIGAGERVGALWVWTRSGGVWSQQGARLVASDPVESGYQGTSAALSADGNTAMTRAFSGGVWVWTRSGDVWTQQGTKLVGTGASESAIQGWSVALSGDGNTAMIGGPFDSGDNTGSAWLWTRSGGIWRQQGNKLFGSGADGKTQFGASVSLSADGKTAIVGGSASLYTLKTGIGAAWVFVSEEPVPSNRRRGINH